MRTSRPVETAVLLGGDVLALAFTVSVVNPGLAQDVLWVLGALSCFAAIGLYAHRPRRSPLDDFPMVVLGSAVGVAVMSLAGPPGLRHAVIEALLAGFLVVFARVGTYAVLGSRRRRLFDRLT